MVMNFLYLELVNDAIALPLLGKMDEFLLPTNTSDHVYPQDIMSLF